MKTPVNIFFNGDECFFPGDAAWEKFLGLDTARLFLVCAESWERNGWDVRRLSTLGGEYTRTPFDYKNGKCSDSFHWYPAEFWQFIAKAKHVAAKDKTRLHWFATIDIINLGFRGDLAEGFRDSKTQDCVKLNLQREHDSLGCFAADFAWLEYAESVLLSYDAGRLAALDREYVSDETILREYARHGRVNTDAMSFACNTEKDTFKLLHFSRSAVRPAFTSYRLS
jgi:hypothetical protein